MRSFLFQYEDQPFIIIVPVDIGWQDISFKFDGFLTGLGELADKIMNQLGVKY